MIVLDTNVVSEVMRPRPETAVLDWLDRQATELLFLTAITVAEIEFGLRALPRGRRREQLREQFQRFLGLGFDGRVVDFDPVAARCYGELMARRRRLGRPMSVLDGQIAAITKAQRFRIATRNVRDFADCGIEIVNPFDPEVL